MFECAFSIMELFKNKLRSYLEARRDKNAISVSDFTQLGDIHNMQFYA